MDPKKEHLLDTPGLIHMDSERLLQHAKYLFKFKPNKFSALRRGGRGKVPSQTKSLFEIDACWEKENQFAPRESHWVYQPYSRAGLMGRGVGQHKTNCVCLFDFVGFVIVFFLPYRYCLFCFSLPFVESIRENPH